MWHDYDARSSREATPQHLSRVCAGSATSSQATVLNSMVECQEVWHSQQSVENDDNDKMPFARARAEHSARTRHFGICKTGWAVRSESHSSDSGRRGQTLSRERRASAPTRSGCLVAGTYGSPFSGQLLVLLLRFQLEL